MRFLVLSTLAVLGVVSTAQAGPFRNYYSTCYQPYYAPSYYYQPYYQTYTPTYTAPATPSVPTYTKDWRTAVVEYSTALKEIEAFNQAMSTIQPGYAASQSTYYGGQGATLYGTPAYSVKTQTESVGVNLELADQRSARFNENLRETLGQANGLRQEFLSQASQENARVAEINAKRDSAALVLQQAASLLQSTNAAPSSKTTTTVSGTGATTVVQPNVDRSSFLKNVARADCAGCHSPGPSMKGGFNVESIGSLNKAQANEILRRLTSTDPAVVMPKPPAGQPVKHVSDEHMAAWVAMLSQVQ